MPLPEKQVTAVMQRVLAAVKKSQPKAEALVSASSRRIAHVRFSRNTVATSGEVDETSLRLTLKLGQRVASAATNQADDASLAALVERTSHAVTVAPEDPEAMPVLGAQPFVRNPNVFDAKLDALGATGRAALVKQAIEPGKARGLRVAGFFQQVNGVFCIASSAGLQALHPATSVELTITARTPSGTGSGRGHFHSRSLAGLDAAAVATKACDGASRSENPRKLEPGRYSVILEPHATAILLRSLVSTMDQRSADEGRSYFSKKKVGERVASPLVTIASDPRSPLTPMLPFDDQGRSLEAQRWITGGTLEALSMSRYWAAKTNRQPIGGHPGMALAAGSTPRSTLTQGIKRGVLISRFWYTNWVDGPTLLLTGLTRDGTYLIEDGQLVAPVNNFRFNQSVADAFGACDALSSEVENASDPETSTPAMRTHDFLLASVSEAV